MDEQIANYPGGKEIPGALYWRGRLYEQQEKRPAMAAAYYQAVIRVYQHYYYAAEAKQRLAALGGETAEYVAMLTSMHAETIPELSDDVPEDDPACGEGEAARQRRGLNEYIARRRYRPRTAAKRSGVRLPRPRSIQLVRRNLPCHAGA